MTHKATCVIIGVTTQPQTGGAIYVITLILPQKRELSRVFNPKGLALWQLPECLVGRRFL